MQVVAAFAAEAGDAAGSVAVDEESGESQEREKWDPQGDHHVHRQRRLPRIVEMDARPLENGGRSIVTGECPSRVDITDNVIGIV